MNIRAEAAVLPCPACGAKPNKPCTKAATRGRRPITWLHLARELEADQLHGDETHPLTPAAPTISAN